MVKHLSTRRRLRLRRELETIRGAVEAARILGEAVATDQLGPERDHRRAPRALTCLLSLVDNRLREIRRASRRGAGDPERWRARDPEPRRAREPRSDGSWSRMSPNERVLTLCAMRQRAHVGDRV